MNTLSDSASILINSLAWALLHSVWQAFTIYAPLYVLFRLLPGMSAKVKYYSSFGALLVVVIWFAATWLIQYDQIKAVLVNSHAGNIVPASTIPAGTVMLTGQYDNPSAWLAGLENYFPFLVLLYTIGLTFMLCRFLFNIVGLRALKTQGLIPLAPRYVELLANCKNNIGVARSVQLYLSDRITVPVMLGIVKPVILLPVATLNHLTIEQLETILLHELAHIKRHDYLLNILQTIVETFLFFNPFVWLLSSVIRSEREHCCDDEVISCASNPLPYANALTILENHRRHQTGMALAATDSRYHLFHRIKRIMEMKKNNFSYSHLAVILAVFIAFTFTIAIVTITPSFAQKAKDSKNDTATKHIYKYKKVTIDKNGKKTVEERESVTPEDEDKNSDATVSWNDTTATKNAHTNVRIYRKVIIDSAGKKRITEKRIVTDDDKKGLDMDKMNADLAQVSRDLKRMAHDLANLDIELGAVNWDKIKDDLDNSLGALEKELNDPKFSEKIKMEVDTAVREGMKAAKEAVRTTEEALKKKEQTEKRK
jgi:bla regulator protein blaR1